MTESMPGPQPASQYQHPGTQSRLGKECQHGSKKRKTETEQDQPRADCPGRQYSKCSRPPRRGTQQEQEPASEMAEGQ
jgi:hypothetical protein